MFPAIRASALPLARRAAFVAPMGVRTVTTLKEAKYTAYAQAGGQGRDGKASLTKEGPYEVKLALPKSLGGSGDGQNPEQLFALGYASCFLSALNLVARQAKAKLPAEVVCHANVSIGPPAEGPKPFAIAVELIITSQAKSDDEKKKLKELVEQAHEVCPYSNATRNNVPVTLKVE